MNGERVGWALVLTASSAALAWVTSRVRAQKTRAWDEAWTATIGARERISLRVCAFAEPRSIAVEAAITALTTRGTARLRAIAAPLLAGLLGKILKRAVERERPNKTRFTPTGGQSFPSTHTAYATALSVAMAPSNRGAATTVLAVAAAQVPAGLIGVARVRAGAHWPGDVVAGWLVGLVSASAVNLALGPREA